MKIVDTHIILYMGEFRKVYETVGVIYYIELGLTLRSISTGTFKTGKDSLKEALANSEDFFEL